MCVMARGMYVDQDKLAEFEVTYPKRVVELREAVKKIHPAVQDWCDKELAQDPNWELDLECKSHLKYILYGIMGLPVKRLTKAGRKLFGESEADWRPQLESGGMSYDNLMEYAALDKFTLSSLVAEHAEIRPLQDYRREFKLYSTYVRPLRNYFSDEVDKRKRVKDAHLCWDSCIHSTFLLTGTRTGRLSSKDPNLQQLPNRGTVKQLFISRFGERGAMYQADLSQIELRLMAAICGDPIMCKAYTDNMDLHTLTASRIYSTDYDHFSKGHFEWLEQHGRSQEKKELELKRRVAKTANFLTGYGGGALGLQTILANNEVYKSLEECEDIIAAFFEAYPALRDFLSYYKRFVADNRVAVSMFGRVRILEEASSNDKQLASKALRAGCNHVIQSTASDMMLVALTSIEKLMRAEGLESILVSTVHDSLLIDAVRKELPIVHEIVHSVLNNYREVLTGVFGDDYDLSWLTVPIAGDCEVGLSYYDTVKIPNGAIDWNKLLAE